MPTTDTSNSADILDIRDLIARIEELRSEREAGWGPTADEWREEDPSLKDHSDSDLDLYLSDREELADLEAFVEQWKGYGGDEQWEGDWYPVTLIRDSYFEEYAEQLADDIGAINSEAAWPNNCIDWERAARELQMDYTGADYRGVTYWGR